MKWKKWIGWLVALVVLAGLAYGGYRWQKAHAAPDIAWKTAPIEKKKIAAKVTASGTLQATVTVQVGAQVSGRIAKLMADFNSTVKKGELIAKIDPQLFQAAVEQAHANYVSSKASVAKADAQERDALLSLNRTKALADQSLASAADLQTAQTNLDVAKASTEVTKASLEQSSANLHQAQVNLSYTDIYSPIDGTVISRSVDVGQTVAASLQAPVLFTIAEDLRKMQVHTNVAEGDVGRLEAGMDATFTVDAFPGQTFKGKVSQIRNAAQTLQNVVTYDAVIDVDNNDLRLRPGMTATVTIIYAERDDAIAIPNAALRFHPPSEAASAISGMPSASASASARHGTHPHPPGSASGGNASSSRPERKEVFVLNGGRPEAKSVMTGLSDGTVTELVKGDLKPGDEVVTDVVLGGKPATASTAPASTRMGRMF
ncbi:MAG TPA: efflux RND transporter periplasmic adaptor subunit [Labilithrix sp.]|jgi:HlyD family secretion protein